MTGLDWLRPPRRQLLVVHDPGDLARFVRGRYPEFDVSVAPTYLAGIAALSDRRAHGLLVGLDSGVRKLDSAVSGLRKAAGEGSRLVLCCPPSGEPLARRVLGAGADDYLIYPPNGAELDKALDLPPSGQPVGDVTPTESMPSWDELTALAGILAGLADDRQATLDRLCRLVADSLRSPGVRIVVGQQTSSVGEARFDAAIGEPIMLSGKRLGEILVGPRQRAPFSASEAEKLRHYARLMGHLLEAADQQHQWQKLAMIDEVSQLPNRRYLLQALPPLVERAKTERSHLTLLLFDLDGFKHFNDTYGHSAGDEIIRETGQLFRKACRPHDIVARYAGDEFVVVFWDAEEPRVVGSQHPRDVLGILRRFRQALEKHAFERLGDECTGHITISGGLASFPWDATDAQGLIEKADAAMLRAKQDGKNRIYLVGTENASTDQPTS